MFVVAAFTIGFMSLSVSAKDKLVVQTDKQVIYQSQSVSNSIYSYLNSIGGKLALKPKLIYVSRANGPAIHSYPLSVNEKAVSWNVEYVDTSFGPAIYSYGRTPNEAEVNVLPIEIN